MPDKKKTGAANLLAAYAKALKLIKVEGEVVKPEDKPKHERRHHPHTRDWDGHHHHGDWTY